MSSSKADSRYTQRYDDYVVCSDYTSDEAEIPSNMVMMRKDWVEEHYQPLEELYHMYLHAGRAYFGNSFYQCGDFGSFINFVYKYTQPGAS